LALNEAWFRFTPALKDFFQGERESILTIWAIDACAISTKASTVNFFMVTYRVNAPKYRDSPER
jgi:hypothetical protein